MCLRFNRHEFCCLQADRGLAPLDEVRREIDAWQTR